MGNGERAGASVVKGSLEARGRDRWAFSRKGGV